jgi:hypothetical protein
VSQRYDSLKQRVELLERELDDVRKQLRHQHVGLLTPPIQPRLAQTVAGSGGYPSDPATVYPIVFLDGSFTESPGNQTPSWDMLSGNEQRFAFSLSTAFIPEDSIVQVWRQNNRYWITPAIASTPGEEGEDETCIIEITGPSGADKDILTGGPTGCVYEAMIIEPTLVEDASQCGDFPKSDGEDVWCIIFQPFAEAQTPDVPRHPARKGDRFIGRIVGNFTLDEETRRMVMVCHPNYMPLTGVASLDGGAMTNVTGSDAIPLHSDQPDFFGSSPKPFAIVGTDLNEFEQNYPCRQLMITMHVKVSRDSGGTAERYIEFSWGDLPFRVHFLPHATLDQHKEFVYRQTCSENVVGGTSPILFTYNTDSSGGDTLNIDDVIVYVEAYY